MNLPQLINKYQQAYYDEVKTARCQTGKSELAKAIVDDLIALQTEVKEKLEAMRSPRSHLNPVFILKEMIE